MLGCDLIPITGQSGQLSNLSAQDGQVSSAEKHQPLNSLRADGVPVSFCLLANPFCQFLIIQRQKLHKAL